MIKVSIKLIKSMKVYTAITCISIVLTVMLLITMRNFSGYISNTYDNKIQAATEDKTDADRDLLVNDEDYQKSKEIVHGFIQVICIIVVIIASCLIASIYSQYLTKCSSIIQTVRIIGGRPRDLKKIMNIQAVFITASSCLIGFLAARMMNEWVIRNFLTSGQASQIHFLSVDSIWITIGVFGLIVLLMTGFIWRQVRILPNEVFAESVIIEKAAKGIRGKVLLASGLFLMFLYVTLLIQSLSGRDVFGRMLACMIFFLVWAGFLLVPAIGGVIRFLTWVCNRSRSTSMYLALQLLKPQIHKNRFIVLAVTFITVFSCMANDFNYNQRNSTSQYNRETYLKEFDVVPQDMMCFEDLNQLTKTLQNKDFEGFYLYQLNTVNLPVSGGVETCNCYMASLKDLESQGVVHNQMADSMAVINRDTADALGLSVGDSMQLPIRVYKENGQGDWKVIQGREFVIGEIIPQFKYDIIIDQQYSEYRTQDKSIFDLFLSGDSERLNDELKELSVQYPIRWTSLHDTEEYGETVMNQEWNSIRICKMILFLMIGFGFLQSLYALLRSREREMYILHSIGMKPVKMIQMLYCQIFLYLMIGVGLGILLSIFVKANIYWSDTGRIIAGLSRDSIIDLAVFILFVLLAALPEVMKMVGKKQSEVYSKAE